MAHMVLKKGRYWELQESYRDARGRPRKRLLKYLGVYSVDWRATFASELHGLDWDAIERQECERLDREEAARDAKLEALNQQHGLRVGPVDPVPVEPTHTAPAPPVGTASQESQPEQPSEPGTDTIGTATPS
jgi:hypothetical protein